jgi:3-phenylpropionate/trans-cinnamate dioxygenase ferredoxin subunit
VAVVRIGDEVHAVSDVCSHAEVALSEGVVDPSGTIECWLHGSQFDLRTGEPQEPPAWEPVQVFHTRIVTTAGVPTVEVSVQAPESTAPPSSTRSESNTPIQHTHSSTSQSAG